VNQRSAPAADRASGPVRPHAVPHALLRSAALELFAANGYEATTVDEIARQAGMSRRTFFRHFSSKEDVIFPDHDALLAAVEELLSSPPVGSPVASACAAMRTVFDSYLAEPDVALQRYRLTHTIPTLRDREITSVSRYQRLLTGYLGQHNGKSVEAALRAELVAAAVIAAHNHVLRRWLRRGCTGRPRAELDRAFDLVVTMTEPVPRAEDAVARNGPARADPTEIVVVTSSLSLPEIKRRLARSD